MVNVLWASVLVAILAGYGMLRGFSPARSKRLLLMALGAAVAALSEIGGPWAWGVIVVLCIAILVLCYYGERAPGSDASAAHSNTTLHRQRASGATPRQATLHPPAEEKRRLAYSRKQARR